MMYRSGKGSPHSHGTPVDILPTTAGIPSSLNSLPRYYREFESHFRGLYCGALLSVGWVCVYSVVHSVLRANK